MEKLIILSGEDNCGKTATLNYLSEVKIGSNGKLKGLPKDLGNGDKVYEFNYREHSVVVLTRGDYENEVEDNFKQYANSKDVDVLISACNWKHTRRRKHKPFEIAINHYSLATIVLKAKALNKDSEETLNKQCADYLFSLLDLSIDSLEKSNKD